MKVALRKTFNPKKQHNIDINRARRRGKELEHKRHLELVDKVWDHINQHKGNDHILLRSDNQERKTGSQIKDKSYSWDHKDEAKQVPGFNVTHLGKKSDIIKQGKGNMSRVLKHHMEVYHQHDPHNPGGSSTHLVAAHTKDLTKHRGYGHTETFASMLPERLAKKGRVITTLWK